MNCSVAQCLEVVGEWWSMLIVRDAFLGVRRFDEFQSRLGISRNISTTRLTSLVEAGVLERVPYQERPAAPRIPAHGQEPGPLARAHHHARVGRQVGSARWRARSRSCTNACGEVMAPAATHAAPAASLSMSVRCASARPGRNTERLRSDRPGCADMSAAHVEQLAAAFAVVSARHPATADAQTVLAPVAARRHVADLVEVSAGSAHANLRGASWSAGMTPSRPAWKSSMAWRISGGCSSRTGP